MQTEAISSLEHLRDAKLYHTHYSIRRYFVDRFYYHHKEMISRAERILDVGGKKVKKRGCFNVDLLTSRVEYLNLDKSTMPDIFASADAIPRKDSTYDLVICSELLEHVYDPKLVLSEIARVLKPGATALITVPFMYPFHADPSDFGRYAKPFWEKTLRELDFSFIDIREQGTYFTTIANSVKILHSQLKSRLWRALLKPLVLAITYSCVTLEIRFHGSKQLRGIISNFHLGYAIVARR